MDSYTSGIIAIFIIQLIIIKIINPKDWQPFGSMGTSITGESLVPSSNKSKVSVLGFIGIGIFLAFGINIILISINNKPQELYSNAMTYSLAIILPLFIITFLTVYIGVFDASEETTIMYRWNKFYNSTNPSIENILLYGSYLIYTGFFLFCVIGIPVIYSRATKQYITEVTFVLIALVFLGLVVGLAMVFVMLRYSGMLNWFWNYNGNNVMLKLIFYLPCLLLDFISYIRKEMKITANNVYILLVFELMIILAYHYANDLSKLLVQSGNPILPTTQFLNVKQYLDVTPFTINQNISLDVANSSVKADRYGLSMWIYLNLQDSAIKDKCIFQYGIDGGSSGNPRISYSDDKTNPDSFTIFFTNAATDLPYKIKLTKQKWHNLVFNYSGSSVDLFVNGILNYTYVYSNYMPIYSPTDIITIGDEDGLSGAICNIKLHNVPLTYDEIATQYNLLVLKNPPVDI
jgi:hypothetical protein